MEVGLSGLDEEYGITSVFYLKVILLFSTLGWRFYDIDYSLYKDYAMWVVITTDLFNEWLALQDEPTQEKILAALIVLQQQGPSLGRPFVDSIYGSTFTNMKELRIQHCGKPLRAFFVFDPLRQAIVLCIADKRGKK